MDGLERLQEDEGEEMNNESSTLFGDFLNLHAYALSAGFSAVAISRVPSGFVLAVTWDSPTTVYGSEMSKHISNADIAAHEGRIDAPGGAFIARLYSEIDNFKSQIPDKATDAETAQAVRLQMGAFTSPDKDTPNGH